MRKLVLFIACSLDGYIARNDGGIDWLPTDQDYNYTSFYEGIDTVVMGRKTYDLALTFGGYPYKGKTSYVFTRNAVRRGDDNAVFVSREAGGFIQELKKQKGKGIWLVGGGEVVRECVKQDLIDEYILSYVPVILGDGVLLFPPPGREIPLKLVKSESFNTGLVQMTYHRRNS